MNSPSRTKNTSSAASVSEKIIDPQVVSLISDELASFYILSSPIELTRIPEFLMNFIIKFNFCSSMIPMISMYLEGFNVATSR